MYGLTKLAWVETRPPLPQQPTQQQVETGAGLGAAAGLGLGAYKGYSGRLNVNQSAHIHGTVNDKADVKYEKLETPFYEKYDQMRASAEKLADKGKLEASNRMYEAANAHANTFGKQVAEPLRAYRERLSNRLVRGARVANGFKGGLVGLAAGTALGVGVPMYMAHHPLENNPVTGQ